MFYGYVKEEQINNYLFRTFWNELVLADVNRLFLLIGVQGFVVKLCISWAIRRLNLILFRVLELVSELIIVSQQNSKSYRFLASRRRISFFCQEMAHRG